MLTGENPLSIGEAFIKGYSVSENWRDVSYFFRFLIWNLLGLDVRPNNVFVKAALHVGYCPQFDAVLKEMTGSETLTMFARIRGIPPGEISRCVDATIEAIGIGNYAKRPIKTYR